MHQLINQPINQSTGQSIHQSIDQASINQLINQSIMHPPTTINQQLTQPINQIMIKTIHQPINQQMNRPINIYQSTNRSGIAREGASPTGSRETKMYTADDSINQRQQTKATTTTLWSLLVERVYARANAGAERSLVCSLARGCRPKHYPHRTDHFMGFPPQ